jgi:hypothetical protein
MKKISLDNLLISGSFFPGLRVGLTKQAIEIIIGRMLDKVYLETPDLKCYLAEIKTDYFLTLYFDKNDLCFEIRLDFEKNKDLELIVQFGRISENILFEKLISIILKSNVEWEFDIRRVYLQTVCVKLRNELRFFYAFGKKDENDFGLFAISSILEPHVLTNVGNK